MKLIALLSCGAPLLLGIDPQEIVRRSVELDQRNTQLASSYTYLQRRVVRELDRSGKVKSQEVETWEVTLLEESPYRRLVARNDRPLSPQEQQREEEKLRRSMEERRHESIEQHERRLAEWHKRQEKQREPIKDLPQAFSFQLTGEENLDGRPVYVIDAMPRPGYQPKSTSTSFFPKIKLRLWIDRTDFQGAKIEMESLDTISLGAVLVRLSKGTRLVIEQTRVNDEVWLPKKVSLAASARVFVVKGLNRELEVTYSDYKKLPVGPRMIAAQ
ncbi:MAG: hypothetical protein C5B51_06185 [Terriglobia bacterium]|nr:MAG: hypothetical protein C5B51_06185 [Terriglobia bacterium]